MTIKKNQNEQRQQNIGQVPRGYFIPMPISEPDDRINILDLWRVLVEFKRHIAVIVFVCVTISLVIAFLITPVYRAEVLLAPAASDRNSDGGIAALASQFGGLASFAGISTGGGGDIEMVIATLKSRKFITQFIDDLKLKPILFKDQWDSESNKWIANEPSVISKIKRAVITLVKNDSVSKLQPGEPSSGMAYNKFRTEMLNVLQDKKTQLVTVSIEWKNPLQSAEWANALVKRLNEELRQKTINEAERSIAYLKEQISQTSLSELQNVLYRVIEEHTKIITLAKVNEEYVMKVIDPATPSEIHSKPKRKLIITLGVFIGVLVGVFLAIFLNAMRNWQESESQRNS